jgi:hypothetical protein
VNDLNRCLNVVKYDEDSILLFDMYQFVHGEVLKGYRKMRKWMVGMKITEKIVT